MRLKILSDFKTNSILGRRNESVSDIRRHFDALAMTKVELGIDRYSFDICSRPAVYCCMTRACRILSSRGSDNWPLHGLDTKRPKGRNSRSFLRLEGSCWTVVETVRYFEYSHTWKGALHLGPSINGLSETCHSPYGLSSRSTRWSSALLMRL